MITQLAHLTHLASMTSTPGQATPPIELSALRAIYHTISAGHTAPLRSSTTNVQWPATQAPQFHVIGHYARPNAPTYLNIHLDSLAFPGLRTKALEGHGF